MIGEGQGVNDKAGESAVTGRESEEAESTWSAPLKVVDPFLYWFCGKYLMITFTSRKHPMPFGIFMNYELLTKILGM